LIAQRCSERSGEAIANGEICMIGWHSTRSKDVRIASLREAIVTGQAPDGGLWMPDRVPLLEPQAVRDERFPALAATVLQPWFADELAAENVESLCSRAFNFPVPLVALDGDTYLLELFHGPTAAFKDFGARFLALSMDAFRDPAVPLTVLVATSGDTGAAVALAFGKMPNARVVLLYPGGRVSPFQELQLTAVPENVTSYRVEGTFDDCQAMVRAAFADPALSKTLGLTSANSINIGRLLPQVTYFVHACARLQVELALPSGTGMPGRHRSAPAASDVMVCVPSGNLGNLTAGLLAKRQGASLGHFLAATNCNDALVRWLATSKLESLPAVATPSNAMDVGNPSNAARIAALYDGDLRKLRQDLSARAIDDDTTLEMMRRVHATTGRFVCPHTAVALAALQQHREQTGESTPAIVLATAHPAKFGEVVERATGKTLPLPPALARLEASRRPARPLRADPAAMLALLRRQG
jgi:threonine synthase